MEPTIPAAVVSAARSFGPAPALVEPGGERLSFAELLTQVRIMARALIAEGLRPGDRLAVWAPNTSHWVLAALGASYAGATLVPVNTRFTAVEALDVMHRSDARGLVVTGPFLGEDRLAALQAAAGHAGLPLPHLVVRTPTDVPVPPEPYVLEWPDFLSRAADVPPRAADARADAVTPGDVSDILFTSGTTGRSKGAMSAHRQSLDVAAAWAGIGGLVPDDRYLVVNPFFHSFGLKAGLLACLVSGATVVPQAVFDAGSAMALIAAERITVLPGPPTLYISLLDHPERSRHDLSSLRLAVTGAATVPPALIARMRAELGVRTVLTAYGLTEAVVATMCRPGDDDRTVAYTCGRAAAGFEVAIGEPTGEVLLRGPNVMLGYLDDKDATAAAIDADGWLHTGDIGRLDERGYLSITDRLKDMFICGGFNVYPAEVERALADLPGVADSAVVGVADPRLGEVGKAYVIPRPGYELTGDQVIEFCRGRLAAYKVPRAVELRAELPRNASGKVLKYLLREENG
ncbi:FadD3 family acyl-CoA ligase [Couchioplanes caeruleus]|uniref:Fatty acid--CoA ligase n=2 Tax=Couchioplanes caeruleus TaxID=56438 RepID=A0A1K0F912_9ACTN|nr:FadD3 family acyl-CoA ligase [Couchioplanes caeruleus]OJF09329.1 fatty acid--CoA ligase [Couchioplanes caeruleus subsp. caeruleus]ROP28047.1 acyl-CoA synthetase (AMP-forming)/AMP-acid ligase II [Couchioplanes caeruleus]